MTCSTADPTPTNPLLIFRQGAGHVSPAAAMNPGLVYDSGFTDWLNFICGVQPGSFCSAFTPIDPSNLNVASIAIGDMAGTQTVTRTRDERQRLPLATYTRERDGHDRIQCRGHAFFADDRRGSDESATR